MNTNGPLKEKNAKKYLRKFKMAALGLLFDG